MTQKDGCLEVIEPLRQQRVELNEPACVEVTQCHVMGAHVAQIGLIMWHQLRLQVQQAGIELRLCRLRQEWGPEQDETLCAWKVL